MASSFVSSPLDNRCEMKRKLMLHCQELLTTNCMIFTPCSLKIAGSCSTSCPVVAVQSCRATHILFSHICHISYSVPSMSNCLSQHSSKTVLGFRAGADCVSKGHRHTSQKLYRKHGKKQILCLPPWTVRQ